MKYIFMIPIVFIDIAGIIFFILFYSNFARLGLNGIGIVGFFFYTLYAIATVSHFKNGIPENSTAKILRKGIQYLVFLLIFTPVYFGALYFLSKTLYNILQPFFGNDVTVTLSGAGFAIVLTTMSAAVWAVNNWIAPEKK